jgi:hypothetical protein
MTPKKYKILFIAISVLTVWWFFGGLLELLFQGIDNGDYATTKDWVIWLIITALLGYSAFYFRKKYLKR